MEQFSPLPVDPLHRIMQKSALPLLLFSAVLTGLLFLSWLLLLPRLTSIDLGIDGTVSLSDVRAELIQTESDVAKAQAERDSLVLPERSALYEQLQSEKRTMQVSSLLSNIRRVVATVSPADDVVVFFREDIGTDGSVTLEGEIRNVGMKSITVLAELVEELRDMAGVEDMQPVNFERTTTDAGPVSPFRISFTYNS